MKTIHSALVATLAACCVMTLSTTVYAGKSGNWKNLGQNPLSGGRYVVSDGDKSITMPDQKSADNAAKILNDATGSNGGGKRNKGNKGGGSDAGGDASGGSGTTEPGAGSGSGTPTN